MKDALALEFDATAYSLLAVQKACHRFSNIASFDIRQYQREGHNVVLVTATALGQKSDEGLEHLGQLLRNEALDQCLREQIRSETEGVRNLILAHAFSRTGLIAPDGQAPSGSSLR